MDTSQMRVRPGFLLGLLVVLVFLGALLFGGVPSEKQKTKAKVILTRVEARLIAELLAEQAVTIGGLSNLTDEFVLNSLRSTQEHQYPFAKRTNSSGEAIDIWQTTFQIKLIEPTNFSISSAGPNCRFGDKDDITFNGGSNDFIRP